jgi:hypothetical protein
MIGGQTISALITTYTRYGRLEELIIGWLAQPIDQLWILDGGGRFKTALPDPRLLVFNLPTDLGTKMDYAFALLTEGDLICLADDDVLVKPGFLEDLHRCWASKGGIVGILGRTFHGPVYWGNTRFYRASLIKEPTRAGFVGVIYLAGRDLFGFDVRGLPRNCDDLWWQMKIHPDIPKHVAPTIRYENLPVASDETAMYKQPALRAQREAFYREHYLKTYAQTERIF